MEKVHGCPERKYAILRRRLDELGYYQPLSFEALILVEKLLNDLLHTTDRLSQYKNSWQKVNQEYGNLRTGVGPYVTENEKLKQECKYLQSKALQQFEDADRAHQKLKSQVHALKNENTNLQFLNSEYISKVRTLEKGIAERNHRIIQLQNENVHAIIIDGGSNKTEQWKKQQTLEVDYPIPLNTKWKDNYLSVTSQVKDPFIANMVSVADDKIESLSKELEDVKFKNGDFQEMIASLRHKVINQEKEIFYLKHKTFNETHSSECSDGNETVAKSRAHPDIVCDIKSLEKINKDLKDQLKEALDKQHEAMEQAVKLANRNQDLEKELHDLDHMALAVETECKLSLRENSEKVENYQLKLESSLVQIHELEQEILDLKHKNVHLKKQIDENSKGGTERQNNAEMVLEEKKKEVERLNKNVSDLSDKAKQLSHTIWSQKQRIIELESKILQSTGSLKRDSGRSLDHITAIEHQAWSRTTVDNSDSHSTDHAVDRAHVTFTDSHIKPEAKLAADHSKDLVDAMNDVRRLEEECSALRKQLQMETELHESEKAKLEKALTQTEELLRKIQAEQQELSSGHGSLRAIVCRHESTISKLEESLKSSRSDHQREKNLNTQLKTLQEQTERALVEAQTKLAQIASEQSVMQERVKGSEENTLKINKEAKTLKAEGNKLRDSLVQLDREKDSLLIKIDEKTERIVGLESELKSNHSRISSLERTIAEMNKKLDVTVDESVVRDHEKRNLQQEVDRLRQELSVSRAQKENALRENRQIQDDLASITNEYRINHRELEDSRREIEDLKLQLQGYVDEVRRIEELLAQKEEERSDLLEQFRNLSAEASVLESTNHSLESETGDARIQLRLINERVLDLERQLDDSHSLITGYEQQIASLTRQVATFEMQFRTHEEQKSRLEADLVASRELCQKLDSQREQLVERLSNSTSDKTSVDKEASQRRKEFDRLKSTLESNKERLCCLESRLLNKEKECLEEQMTNEKLKREIERLQENIVKLENKLDKEMAAVNKYQKKALEIGPQSDRTEKDADDPISDRSSDQKSSISGGTYDIVTDSRALAEDATKTVPSSQIRWHGMLPSGSEVSVVLDEKEDDDLLIRLDSPTNSCFSG